MPNKYVIKDCPGPFHVTARSINKEWFSIPMENVWEIFSNQLYFLHHAFKFKIHSFVLMANHYHLIVSTPDLNLSEGMAYFQRECSRELNRQGNRMNRTFAGRYFKSHLANEHYFSSCYKYVYQNPIRKGIVDRCENYRFSTLHGLLGQAHLIIPIVEDTLLFSQDLIEYLKWINEMPNPRDLESMRNALRRGVFKLRKRLDTCGPNTLEFQSF